MTISFRNNSIYKMEYYAGIFNIVIIIMINIFLWQALYKSQNIEGTIQHRMMLTYIVLSIIFQSFFVLNESFIESKIRDGTIIHYLLKPMSFRLYAFFSNLGTLIFNFIFLFIPALIIVLFAIKILPPDSWINTVWFALSAFLGYLVLFNFSFIFWSLAMDFITSFGFIMLKGAVVAFLSGAILPLWFMPDQLAAVVKLLPFQTIYYFPLSIYLGLISENEIYVGIGLQILWIGLFALVGHLTWKINLKKIVVQGG